MMAGQPGIRVRAAGATRTRHSDAAKHSDGAAVAA
jgi:hypothetical protein